MKKSIFCALVLAASGICRAQTNITPDVLKTLQGSYAATPTDKALRNAISNVSIQKLAVNMDNTQAKDTYFNVEVKNTGISDQKGSGRCWLFTGTNVLRNRAMKNLVADDRAKTKILPLSKFGLMEMTRQREHESIQDVVYDPCPYCNGTGRVKSALSMSVEIQRRLKEVLKRRNSRKKMAIRVIMNPAILARLKNEDAELLRNLEEEYGKALSFRADPTIHIEDFKLIDPDSGREI